jgi:hypothetical protein
MSDEVKRLQIPLENATSSPIIFLDEAPVFGMHGAVGHVALTAVIQDEDGQGGVTARRVVVAHLRGTVEAFASLRNAINGMELILTGPARPEGPTN